MDKIYDCSVRIRVKEKDSVVNTYFGRGVADLLHGVKIYHSLSLSAQHMDMAYSKAWRIIKQAEAVLGIQLLHRMGKKGSKLTPEGERFLMIYEEAEQAASKAARRIFEKYHNKGEE